MAGVLLQTTRNYVTHTCTQRFDKFATVCTEQQVVYDEETGEAVTLNKSSGGLSPYGVDAVFLADSSAYDDTVAVGKHHTPSSCLSSSESLFKSAHVKHGVLPCGCTAMLQLQLTRQPHFMCKTPVSFVSSSKNSHKTGAPAVTRMSHSKKGSFPWRFPTQASLHTLLLWHCAFCAS